jgi:hypothetical protein
MQKIATRVFIISSLVFGVLGIILVLTMPEQGNPPEWLRKAFFTTVFIILPSFALSVASKYLNGKK